MKVILKNKLLYFALITLAAFPSFSFAAELSFTPAPTDMSVKYLSAIFGNMEGVLVSSGSQILGKIFGMLNAAVLAVGGIILLYILVISTINTAASGEAMGKTWSSTWIPLRAAIGIALLLPKASGYSTIQTMMM